jgi:Holliday junction resolvase RusA-like endonuclease
MTQRSKWTSRARRYLDSQHELALAFRVAMSRSGWMMIQRGNPLHVTIIIEHAGGFHNRDLDNEVKAILDAAQGVVFEDDRWVDDIEAWRTDGDQERITLIVKEV